MPGSNVSDDLKTSAAVGLATKEQCFYIKKSSEMTGYIVADIY